MDIYEYLTLRQYVVHGFSFVRCHAIFVDTIWSGFGYHLRGHHGNDDDAHHHHDNYDETRVSEELNWQCRRACRAARSDAQMSDGVDDGLHASRDSDFLLGFLNSVIHGLAVDAQDGADLPVGLALGSPLQALEFSFRQ